MADIEERISNVSARLLAAARRVGSPLSSRLKRLVEALASLVEAIDSGAISAADANEALEKLLADLEGLLIAIGSANDAASDAAVSSRLDDVDKTLSDLGVTQSGYPGPN